MDKPAAVTTIVDCCSLINLYSGWGGLSELSSLHRVWCIGDAVLNEAAFIREFDPLGIPEKIALDLQPAVDAKLLLVQRIQSRAELYDFVDFSMEIDDGEAQALALAKHRGYSFLTDDRGATKFAERDEVAVKTITTAEILKEWAQLNQSNDHCLSQIIPDQLKSRITSCTKISCSGLSAYPDQLKSMA